MTQFSDMPLSPALKQRLAASSFITPTPIQDSAIPHALAGKDIVATAQTGTGKTLAFLVPIIEALGAPCSADTRSASANMVTSSRSARGIDALVLVPTRELAMQVHEQYEQLRGKQLPPAALVVGGLKERGQLNSLRAGARVVVATPGRLEDFVSRRLINLKQVRVLVLDEADRMLDMGFLPALRRIVSVLPSDRQTLCFSATLEASVAGLVYDYTRDAVRLEFGSTLKPVDSVELQAFEVNTGEKPEALRQLLYAEKGQSLVFARTKRSTERLAKTLVRDGFAAAMIHGDRTQAQRTGALAGFQAGKYQILVATDVASRGIHVDDVAHVINYDLPQIAEDFIHRVGRTGRAGARGRSSTLVSGAEVFELKHIERTLKLRIARKTIGSTEPPKSLRPAHNTLPSRTLSRLPGEVFV